MKKEGKTNQLILQVCSGLLIVLWSYSSMSKFADLEKFRRSLDEQHFFTQIVPVLKIILPSVEVLTALLIAIPATKKAGFITSTILMLAFTIYVGLAVFGWFEKRPCSCGGVLSMLSWKAHLYFNIFFLFLSSLSLYLNRPPKPPFPSPEAT